LPFWRRQKPLHQQLAEGTELLAWEPEHEAAAPSFSGTLDVLHGGRPKRWDVVVTTDAPLLTGDEVHFVALPDGTLIVDETVANGALDPLAEALEQQLRPPYRAEAVRRDALWAVGANRIEVVELHEHVSGDAVVLALRGRERHVVVDGAPSLAALPTLEAYAGARYADYVARADRIDEDVWEVRVTAL
jgi:hypothetical protein